MGEKKTKLPDLPRWVGEKEAADLLCLSVAKLQQDRHHNQGFPYYKNGRTVRYKLDDLLKTMEACRIDPAAKSAAQK